MDEYLVDGGGELLDRAEVGKTVGAGATSGGEATPDGLPAALVIVPAPIHPIGCQCFTYLFHAIVNATITHIAVYLQIKCL